MSYKFLYNGKLVVDITGTTETVKDHPDASYVLKDLILEPLNFENLKKFRALSSVRNTLLTCQDIFDYLQHRGWVKIACLPPNELIAADIERKALYREKPPNDNICTGYYRNLDFLF